MRDLLHPDELYETGEPPRTAKSLIEMIPKTSTGSTRAIAHILHTDERLGSAHCMSPEALLIERETETPDDGLGQTRREITVTLAKEGQKNGTSDDGNDECLTGQTGSRAFKFGTQGSRDKKGNSVPRSLRTRNAGPLDDLGRKAAKNALRELRDY